MKLDDLSGPMNGRLVAVRQEVWFIPNAKYELWRLPRRGLPLRRVEVPECLAAKGRRITGDENVRLYQEMLKDVSEASRKFWMKGKMRDSFWPAATSAAAYRASPRGGGHGRQARG